MNNSNKRLLILSRIHALHAGSTIEIMLAERFILSNKSVTIATLTNSDTVWYRFINYRISNY